MLLTSARIQLRPITLEDAGILVAWRNNPLILDTVFSPLPITMQQHLAWYERLQKSSDRVEFIIELKNTQQPIGRIGLANIDHLNQKAEYSISLGEVREWGKGYGSEATELILQFGFCELNLHKIYLKVFAENLQAVHLYEKHGFSTEGRLVDEVFKHGEFKTVLQMSLLRESYLKAKRHLETPVS